MANNLLRQDGDATGVPGLESSATITWVNDLHKQFFDEYLKSYGNYPAYMKKEKGYTAASSTALAADVAAGATSLTVDSSSALDTSGAAVIYKNSQYDIFTHTGNSGGTVSGIPASGTGTIDFSHEEDEEVSKLYALPSDFGRMRIEKERGEGVRVNGSPFFQTPDMPSSGHYSLWQGESWYLWMPRGQSGDILVAYDKKPTTLSATTTEIDIPEQYPDHWYIVWGLVGIFKRVLDDEYVAQIERIEQDKVLNAAFARPNAGKKLSASNGYFRRYGI